MLCEMERDTDQNTIENLPDKDSAVEEPVSPLLLPVPIEDGEEVSNTALTSLPAAVTANESQDSDEDEGRYSHDESGLSNNTSQDSDNSGLHGALSWLHKKLVEKMQRKPKCLREILFVSSVIILSERRKISANTSISFWLMCTSSKNQLKGRSNETLDKVSVLSF